VVRKQQDMHLEDWQKREELAEKMLPLLGQLYRDRKVVVHLYGRSLNNCSTIDILKGHRWVRQVMNNELSIHDSYPLLKVIATLDLAPCVVDLGKLTVAYCDQGKAQSVEEFVEQQLATLATGKKNLLEKPKDVVLYGFGRIGRLLARILVEGSNEGGLLLRAIVVRKGSDNDLQKRANLLRRDSVHGPFKGTITVDEEAKAIIANGNYIQVIYSSAPDIIDYSQYGIQDALVVDNTGIWRDEEGLGLHLKSKGISNVLLTAPGKGDIKNIVYGVNDHMMSADDTILSAASCTTNAITPVLKALNDKYGVENGHVETVHSYTNDQNLIDNFHKGARRGRSAALNMVLTETGAAKAVAKALPELKGKLSGNAIRVPTPNVSMAILNLNLQKNTDKDSLNEYLRDLALHSDLSEQVDYTTSTEVVSSDLVGSIHAGIVDSQATIVNDNRCVLYVWYDNEFGYSWQVVRIMKKMAGIVFPEVPPTSKAN
jgi:glyceraldehyde 3-phosphate dehydrogenase